MRDLAEQQSVPYDRVPTLRPAARWALDHALPKVYSKTHDEIVLGALSALESERR